MRRTGDVEARVVSVMLAFYFQSKNYIIAGDVIGKVGSIC